MALTIRVLLLEDDLETISAISRRLFELEEELAPSKDIALTVLAEGTQVKQYINADTAHSYDIVLLDRDDKAGSSFHVFDFGKFDLARIISISSTPEWNEMARRRGIDTTIHKQFDQLDAFAELVKEAVRKRIT